MKTMKKGDEVSRIKEEEVQNHLASGWVFCKKTEWKKNVRDKGKKVVEPPKDPDTKTSRDTGKKGDPQQSKYRQKQANN